MKSGKQLRTAGIGVIGFGEVGSVFTRAMTEAGADVRAYDILLDHDEKGKEVRNRILETGSKVGSLKEVVGNSQYVFSTVTTQVAKDVARACSEHLRPGQVYLDLNSTSPAIKIDMSRIIIASGAQFVEGAILGAVGATGPETRILTAGESGSEAADILNTLGLNASYYSPQVGQASTFKMLRSIFSKGLEALILELLIAGNRAGIRDDLWNDITDFMSQKPFAQIASNWVQTHAVAYERRYYEIVQILETMGELGIDPIVTSGTEAFFKRSLSMGLKEHFPVKPESFEDVVEFLEKELRD